MARSITAVRHLALAALTVLSVELDAAAVAAAWTLALVVFATGSGQLRSVTESVLVIGLASGELVRSMETSYLEQTLHQQNHRTFSLLSATSLDAVVSEDRPGLLAVRR